MILRDDKLLQLTTTVEDSQGYENSEDHRLLVAPDGELVVEKMIPGDWWCLRWFNEMY